MPTCRNVHWQVFWWPLTMGIEYICICVQCCQWGVTMPVTLIPTLTVSSFVILTVFICIMLPFHNLLIYIYTTPPVDKGSFVFLVLCFLCLIWKVWKAKFLSLRLPFEIVPGLFFLHLFIFEWQWETEHKWGRGRERRRPRIWSRLQALNCQHRAQCGVRTH